MEKAYQREVIKKGYLLEDFHLFHLKDSCGAEMEFHYHEFCKMVLLVTGQGNYTVEGRNYSLREGDILLIGNGQVHRPEFSEGIEYERFILYISPEFLKKQSTADCSLKALFEGCHGHLLRLNEHRQKKVFELAEGLQEEMKRDSYGKSILGNSLLLQLLVRIGRYLEKGQSAESQTVSDARIKEMILYVEQHLTEELSVEKLAERFYISRFHMMRLFKKETGQSLFGYITERRLFYARNLMRQGIPATESCFAAGFGSYSSFTRAYGKLFGSSPTGRNARYISMDEIPEEQE